MILNNYLDGSNILRKINYDHFPLHYYLFENEQITF